VRLDETELEELTPDASGGVEIDARPNEILTLRLDYETS